MAAARDDQIERFHPEDRRAWRDWLERHHATAPGVWLVSYKKESGRPRVPYAETVEEALCFGWVDSRPNALDATRAMLLFSPRRPGSPWSRLNKGRVERLTAEGLLAPAGLAVVEAARRDGSWDLYDAIEALTVPEDLLSGAGGRRAGPAALRALQRLVQKEHPLVDPERQAARDARQAHRRDGAAGGARPEGQPLPAVGASRAPCVRCAVHPPMERASTSYAKLE